MKLTVLLSFAFFLSSWGTSLSQTVKLSLDLKKVPVEKVIQLIEDQTEFYFLYQDDVFKKGQTVSIQANDTPLETILQQLSDQATVEYRIIDRQIVLLPANKPEPPAAAPAVMEQQQPQGKVVSGTVRDVRNLPLPGVAVVVKGTTTGTVTDNSGNFQFTIPQNAQVLEFSFVGMKKQEMTVDGRTTFQVVLSDETFDVDEVVVVGYGTQTLATTTGSIVTIKGDDLKKAPVINFSNVFYGKMPGLVAVSRSGEPGNDATTLRIRGANTLGNNSPLIVVDGIAGRDLQRLNPEDVESVTVLKDASAAIYGAQAANGVILITTKRGSESPMKVTITHNEGFGMPTVIPKMANSETYAQMINEIDISEGKPPRFSPSDIQSYRDGNDPWRYPDTDWFGETFKPAASQRVTNATLSGGTDKLQYFVSLGYNFQDAIYKNSATNYSQGTIRSNFDAKISKSIKFSLDLSGRQTVRNYPTRSASSIFAFLMRGKPHLHAFWPNGLNGPDIEYGDNPVVITTDQTGYDRQKQYIFENTMKLDVNIPWVKGLRVSGNFSIDNTLLNSKLWQTPWYLYTWDGKTMNDKNEPDLVRGQKGYLTPQLRQEFTDTERITLNAMVNYNTSIQDKHNVNLLVGSERITGESMNFWAFRRYFDSEAIDQLFAGGDAEKNNSGSASQNARLNYFGRFNYDYQGKYLFEFVFRYDGSYIFPAEGRYGFFPGVSAGYRISEENFWQDNLSFIDYFKLRSSWGQTGNDRIEPYQYLTSFGFRSETNIFGGSQEVKNMRELRTPNPNVTWEVANQFNVGFDGLMLGEKISFSADYFYNLRTNILWFRDASVPATSGITLPRENIGKVSNQGIEFSLGYKNRINAFYYEVNVTGGTNKNRIEFWDETPGVPDYQKSTGHPMNSILVYKAIGIFQTAEQIANYPSWAGARPGDIIFEDVNKDEVINGLDRIREYRTDLPTFTGGLSLNLTYKNLYSSMFFQAATGAIRNNYYEMQGEVGNFLQRDVDARWTQDNPSTTNPRIWNRYAQYWRNNLNTYWLQSSDYLRLKNIEIGYKVPIKMIGLDRMTVYFSGQNILTFTAIKDFDPETTSSTAYPLNKVYNFGVSVTF